MFEQIKRLLAPPIFPGEEEKTNVASLLNAILITIFTVALGTITTLMLVQPLPPMVRNIGFVLTAATFLIWLIMRLGYVRPAAVLLATMVLVGGATFMYTNGTIRGPFVPALLVSIIIAGFFVGDVAAYTFAGLSVAVVVSLFQLEQAGMMPKAYDPELRPDHWIISVVVTIVTTVLLQLNNRSRDKSMEALRSSNQALHETSQQLQTRTNALEVATEIGRNLAQIRDLDELLQNAVDLIKSRFVLYYVQIYLADLDHHKLTLRVGTGNVGTLLVRRGHTLPIATGSINGRAAAEQRAIIVADTAASPDFRPNTLLPETRSEMAVPLVIGTRLLGVLNVQSNTQGSLSQETLPTFTAVANQLVLALENARLLTEAEKARQAVEESIQRLTRENWDTYLSGVDQPQKIGFTYDQEGLRPLQNTTEFVHDAHALRLPINLVGEVIGQIEVAAEDDRFWTEEEIALATAVADQVAQQAENLRLLSEAERYRHEAENALRRLRREAWQAYDADHPELVRGYAYDQQQVTPLTDAAEPDAQPAIEQPLLVHNQKFGELAISGAEDDEAAADLLQAVATQLSSHLENLRLTEQTEKALSETQRRSRELAVLNEIARIVGSRLEVKPLLQTILEQLRRVIRLDAFMVMQYDSAQNTSHILIDYDMNLGVDYDLPPITLEPHHMTYHIIQSKQPKLILFTEVEVAEQRQNPPPNLLSEEHTVMASLIFAPLIRGEEVVGVLSVQSHDLNAYSEGDLNLVSGIAGFLATALQNAQLFQTIQRQGEKERVINQVSQKIQQTMTMEAALQTAVAELGQALQAHHTGVELTVTNSHHHNGKTQKDTYKDS